MTAHETLAGSWSGIRSVNRRLAAYWVLRVGAALCFIGHGAFGFITKAAWLPYFGVVGIPESSAYTLMPLVGAVDVMAGMAGRSKSEGEQWMAAAKARFEAAS